MPKRHVPTRQRHALGLVLWFVAFLVAGIVNPVLAARAQPGGFDLRSWCAVPGMGAAPALNAAAIPTLAVAGSFGEPVEQPVDEPVDAAPAAAPSHDLLKCPACWNPMAPPSDAPAVVLHAPADPPRDDAGHPPVRHRLVPGFEPARGPPQA
jgi:hypothetical protein